MLIPKQLNRTTVCDSQSDRCSVTATDVPDLRYTISIWVGLGKKTTCSGFGKHQGLALGFGLKLLCNILLTLLKLLTLEDDGITSLCR